MDNRLFTLGLGLTVEVVVSLMLMEEEAMEGVEAVERGGDG